MGTPEDYARLICKAMHADADPDDKVVSPSSVQTVAGLYILPRWEPMPLWRIYEVPGRAIAQVVEREIELERRGGI